MFDSLFWRRNCHTSSARFSSGDLGGSGSKEGFDCSTANRAGHRPGADRGQQRRYPPASSSVDAPKIADALRQAQRCECIWRAWRFTIKRAMPKRRQRSNSDSRASRRVYSGSKVPGVGGVTRMKGEPARFAIAGAVRELPAPNPIYTAIYEIDDPQVLQSPEWAEAVERGRWPSEVRPHTSRTGSICYSRSSKRGACGTGKAICHWFAHAVALHFSAFSASRSWDASRRRAPH
jgi:hypothetical protein